MQEVAQVCGIEHIDERSIATGLDDYRPPSGTFLLARQSQTVVGCAGLRELSPGIGEIKRMWIHPEHRGEGLGRALLAALEDCAISMGVGRLMLDTNDALIPAMRLYESSGYLRTERYNDNPDATTFYVKNLSPRRDPAADRL
jgi:GNAT superfamily N-acetyltransferase